MRLAHANARSVDRVARILKLLGHPDRLRIVALLSRGELTVSELVSVLELSQPRVTQYIRSLEEAGIIDRLREGSWTFSRLRPECDGQSPLLSSVLSALPQDDPVLQADLSRLGSVRARRAQQSEQFFADVANNRGQLSHEYLPQSRTEAVLLDAIGDRHFDAMVDLGTGSGRMLALLAEHVSRGTGVDLSPDMLRVARHTLSEPRFGHLLVQQSDLTETELLDRSADLVTLHQVLHHLDRPADALREAARLLRADGVLLIVDFAEHDRDEFRDRYAHRRLGFSADEILTALEPLGFRNSVCHRVDSGEADRPDLLVWQAVRVCSAEMELAS